MARPRLNTLNFVYTTVGIGIAAGVGYLVYRRLRNRKAAHGEDNLMDVRRTTRQAARAVKDTVQQVGKSGRRTGTGKDSAESSFEDASSSGKPLEQGATTGYNRI